MQPAATWAAAALAAGIGAVGGFCGDVAPAACGRGRRALWASCTHACTCSCMPASAAGGGGVRTGMPITTAGTVGGWWWSRPGCCRKSAPAVSARCVLASSPSVRLWPSPLPRLRCRRLLLFSRSTACVLPCCWRCRNTSGGAADARWSALAASAVAAASLARRAAAAACCRSRSAAVCSQVNVEMRDQGTAPQ